MQGLYYYHELPSNIWSISCESSSERNQWISFTTIAHELPWHTISKNPLAVLKPIPLYFHFKTPQDQILSFTCVNSSKSKKAMIFLIYVICILFYPGCPHRQSKKRGKLPEIINSLLVYKTLSIKYSRVTTWNSEVLYLIYLQA